MTTQIVIALVVLAMQFVLFVIAIIYFAWKVPTKDDMNRRFDRLERQLNDLNNHFIDHLKNHP